MDNMNIEVKEKLNRIYDLLSLGSESEAHKPLTSFISKNTFNQIDQLILSIKKDLKNGANIDGQDENGNTLLHHVVMSDEIRYYNTVVLSEYKKPESVFDVEALTRDFKPNPLIRNKNGLTPAMLAAKSKQLSDFQMLSAYTDVYVANETALILKDIYLVSSVLNNRLNLHDLKHGAVCINKNKTIKRILGLSFEKENIKN